MPAFLIDLLAPGAQPPVDKLNGCQEIQLEGTCCFSAACAKTDGDMCFWKFCLWAHSLFTASHYRQLLGGILLFAKSGYCQFHFFSSLWWCLDCLLPVKFNRRGVRLTLFKTQVLVRMGQFWERKCHLSMLRYHLTFPESPKACPLITCKILIIRLLILGDYSNSSHSPNI